SLFEPCGLSQMIAMRYGTLPVVRETGGLKDSVIPYNQYTNEGTGFSFANYNAHEMLFTVKNAARVYRDEPEVWSRLMDNAMRADFSWERSAESYKKIYQGLVPEIQD
ncbi:MAG: starch synthase, partial [Lachnospiraceae bacterium]|nr:starch synthase [Lachnospiraceae bacterium]